MAHISIKAILQDDNYKITGKLWVESSNERFLGPGPIALLQLIDETGSINKAAQKMDMSYKKAWKIVNALNAHAKNPIVLKHAGGEKGGGSSISNEAKQLIAYQVQLNQRFQAFLENETQLLNTF